MVGVGALGVFMAVGIGVLASYSRSHLFWLVVNILIYGYNDNAWRPNALQYYHIRAKWYAETLCGENSTSGILDKVWASSLCTPRSLTPTEIYSKIGRNATYGIPGGDPPILIIRKLLTHREADTLIREAKEQGVDAAPPAAVDTNNKKSYSMRSNTRVGVKYRASAQMPEWCIDNEEEAYCVQGKAKKLISQILRISPLQHETSNLQATAIGQQFSIHHDFSYHQVEFLFEEGPRTWTVLTYLTHPQETHGGSTTFPYLNIDVKPKKGDSIIWPNAYQSTLIKDYRLYHAGTMVTKGVKYTFNQNIRYGLAREEQEKSIFYGDMENAPVRRFAQWWRAIA
ncbi:hypothetical protein AAMO2058_001539700 [Amorphochlora amoebiformis]